DPVHAGLLQAEHGGDHGAAGAGVGDVQVHGGTGGLGGAGRFAVGAVELDGEAAEQGGIGVGQVAAVAAAAVHGEFDALGQRGAQRLGGGGRALGRHVRAAAALDARVQGVGADERDPAEPGGVQREQPAL